eukprot:5334172-Prymnesium_polylepis.2
MQNGGALNIENATAALVGGSIVNSAAQARGGALSILDGSLAITNNSLISGCSAESPASYGGAIWARTSVVMLDHSSIVGSYGGNQGGAVQVDSGVLDVRNGSSIANSTAIYYGGAMYISGGSVRVADSFIRHSKALSGTLYLISADLTL